MESDPRSDGQPWERGRCPAKLHFLRLDWSHTLRNYIHIIYIANYVQRSASVIKS